MVVGITGHRDLRKFSDLERRTASLMWRLVEDSGATNFIFGGAMGYDQLCFWIVDEIKKSHPHIKLELALPFYDKSSILKTKAVTYVDAMINRADDVTYVDELKGYKITLIPGYTVGKLFERNRYIVDNSDIIVAAYDGRKSGGTHHCLNLAREKGIRCHVAGVA